MNSRHVEKPKGPKLDPQSTALHEDLEELSPVVDGKVVSDNGSLPDSVGERKVTLDWIVMATVVVGIIVFASFQIQQCVVAYEKPASKSGIGNVSRTFPGVMFCPFSQGFDKTFGVCPRWAADASLAFDFNAIGPGGQSYTTVSFFNTNRDSASQNERSTRCNSFNQGLDGLSRLYFGPSDQKTSYVKQISVRNSARPEIRPDGPSRRSFFTCNSWTPPKVQCLVFDPSSFDEATKADPALKVCNPMREVKANTVDSVDIQTASVSQFGNYEYRGLIPQTQPLPDGSPNPFASAPSQLRMSTADLELQNCIDPRTKIAGANASIFGGVVAVLYDASKGIPTELDFDGALGNSMSSSVLGSTVLISTNEIVVPSGDNPFRTCVQYKPDPVSCSVTSQQDEIFTNALTNQKTIVTRQVVTFTTMTPNTPANAPSRSAVPSLSISFSSSMSVITTEIISLSILTTISIIASTAATLWGSQQKLKEGIVLVTDKVKEFLEKRRTAANPLKT
jgi:hypothetical protein